MADTFAVGVSLVAATTVALGANALHLLAKDADEFQALELRH